MTDTCLLPCKSSIIIELTQKAPDGGRCFSHMFLVAGHKEEVQADGLNNKKLERNNKAETHITEAPDNNTTICLITFVKQSPLLGFIQVKGFYS